MSRAGLARDRQSGAKGSQCQLLEAERGGVRLLRASTAGPGQSEAVLAVDLSKSSRPFRPIELRPHEVACPC